jgi:hypothetical protein
MKNTETQNIETREWEFETNMENMCHDMIFMFKKGSRYYSYEGYYSGRHYYVDGKGQEYSTNLNPRVLIVSP